MPTLIASIAIRIATSLRVGICTGIAIRAEKLFSASTNDHSALPSGVVLVGHHHVDQRRIR
jgi:hypothetical protein